MWTASRAQAFELAITYWVQILVSTKESENKTKEKQKVDKEKSLRNHMDMTIL